MLGIETVSACLFLFFSHGSYEDLAKNVLGMRAYIIFNTMAAHATHQTSLLVATIYILNFKPSLRTWKSL